MLPRQADGSLVDVAARLRASLIPLTRQLRRPDGEFTPTQLSVLGSIHRHQPLTLGDLARRERLSLPMISRVVTSLDQHGLIERVADDHDRRVCLVQISDNGNRWIQQGQATRNAWLADRLSGLDDHELATLEAVIPILDRLLDDDE